MSMVIAVDFDGTIVDHKFPDIGDPVPGALQWLKTWTELGAILLLYTMRSDDQNSGNVLTEAIEFCRSHGIEFAGHNVNPTQHDWTTSPKCYAHVYIDDNAFGCPLRENPRAGGRPYVDWDIVGPAIEAQITARQVQHKKTQQEKFTHDWQPRTSSAFGFRCSRCFKITDQPHDEPTCEVAPE